MLQKISLHRRSHSTATHEPPSAEEDSTKAKEIDEVKTGSEVVDSAVFCVEIDKMGGTDRDSPKSSLRKSNRNGLAIINCLPDLILTLGVALGWYTRWQSYGYSILSTLGIAGIVIFICNVLLNHYCRAQILGSVAYLWYGCLLGIISLLDVSPNFQHEYNNYEDISNLLLVSSVICLAVVELIKKCCRPVGNQYTLWARHDVAQVIGGAAACVIALGANATPLLLVIVSLFSILTAIKFGSLISLGNLTFLLISTEHFLFPELQISGNPFGIICFIGRLAISPLLDLFFGGYNRLERWQGFILSRKIWQRLCILICLLIEFAFFFINAKMVKNHKEWFVVVPFFAIISVIWFLMHFIYLLICGTLVNRFGKCSEQLGGMATTLSLKKVLAARGLRYFSLVAYRLMYVCVFTSVFIGLLCWTTRTPYSHALLSLVVSLELMVTDLLMEFTTGLGGTCIGYGIVAPVASVRSDGMVTVLPPNFIQESGNRSTKTLQAVVDFFTHHMVTNFGCDWSMSGVNSENFETKFKDFISQATPEGPRYDTYLLYYSGPTTASGDWALTGGASVSLEHILSIWRDCNIGGQSRLLLICDCEHSHLWLKPIWRLRPPDNFVGLQTVKMMAKKSDPDLPLSVGDFTRHWVDYNASGGNKTIFESVDRSLKAYYAVSRRWTDFSFHLPTSEEGREYWMQSLPRVTHGCFVSFVVTILSARLPVNCFACFSRLARRCRMKFWPPVELDTGHGFKLISI